MAATVVSVVSVKKVVVCSVEKVDTEIVGVEKVETENVGVEVEQEIVGVEKYSDGVNEPRLEAHRWLLSLEASSPPSPPLNDPSAVRPVAAGDDLAT